ASHFLHAAESPVYHGLQPDGFLKQWLILKPIPVSPDKKGAPDEEAQKKAFAQDWLVEAGGEAKLQTYAGMKQKIGGRDLEWNVVESKTDTVDLKGGSAAGDFAVA